jgi:KDO2-lipid IV(A) lauroyltransferase
MRHRLELAAVYLVRGLIRAMPRGIVRRCGRLLGLAFHLVDAVHRGVADTNLAMAFPQRTAAERRTITREMFGHFGCVLLELLKFSTLSQDDMRSLVEFEGDDRARGAYARGKGVLFFTGHFGYWEINALVHALRFEPFAVLARPLDNPGLHQLLEQVRTSTGNAVIYRQGAIRRVLRVLQSGQGVAMLIDQHMHSADAIYVNFFERPAATTSMLAALALRTGAPVVPVFALPLPGGRYRMIYEHAVDPPDADTPDAVREFTQRCTDVLEMYVRRHPSLWLWMHRRWRDAPLPAGTPGMFPPARAEEIE